ncbi:MAG: HEAT repeat domain-containing protein [Phycisphaerales bacterium]|nr:MAG: HEAT repeat domain-containing protein [Phycisphaerales bacterium]
MSAKVSFVAALVTLCVAHGAAAKEFDKADVDEKLSGIVSYERGMDRQPLIAIEALIRESQNQPAQRTYIERRLADLLDGATLEAKSFICKQLWFIGTADSVPAVARLLLDEKTADMACYAIGQNPSPEASQALRDALDKTGPSVQVRVVNLLGDRRDGRSVEAIGEFVFGEHKSVAEAAVAALGKIGGVQATEILARARAKGDSDLRFAATDAYLRCAEDLVAAGQAAQATVIYRELAKEGEAAIFRSAAVKGLADIGGPRAAPVVVAALRDRNRMVRTTARGCVRTMQGEGVTEMTAAELSKVSADERVLLIGALADRGDPAALPQIIALAESADAQLGKSVLQAVGKLGDASFVDFLVGAAAKGIGDSQKKTALNSLALLRGDGVNDAIVESFQNAEPDVRSQLIDVLSDRDAVDAIPALLDETTHAEPVVRRAALKALAGLGGRKDLPSLVELLVNMQDNSSRREAERAVVAVSRKITDAEERADAVLAALSAEQRVSIRCSLLRVLGGIANTQALEVLTAALKDQDPAVEDAAVRALAMWPDAAAADVLLEIYARTQNKIHRLLALRGFARMMAMPAGNRSAENTLEMCQKAAAHAGGAEEQKLVLSALAHVADPGALKMVEPLVQNEAVRAEAAMACIKIAGAISEAYPDRARAAMDNVLALVQDEDLRKQAEEMIRRISRRERPGG